MNVFIFFLGIISCTAGTIGLINTIYLLAKKRLQPSISSFLSVFMFGACLIAGFLTFAQEIENLRSNPINNQHIEGEESEG